MAIMKTNLQRIGIEDLEENHVEGRENIFIKTIEENLHKQR